MPDESRRISAIMFSDIVGYTATMGQDEEAAIRAVSRSRAVQKEFVRKHQGVWLQEIGDGAMCTFDSAVQAVRCALEIQRAFLDEPDFKVRIGIHVGDLVFRKTDVGTDIFGDAVNVAARVESVCDPGGIAVTERVYDDLRNRKGFVADFMGEKQLKNVNRPIRVYRILDPESPGVAQVAEGEAEAPQESAPAAAEAPPPSRKAVPAALGIAVLLAGAAWFFLRSPGETPVPAATAPTPAPQQPAEQPAAQAPAPTEVAAVEPPAPPPPDPFKEARGALLGKVGPWKEVAARVWTEPDPVPNNETYQIHFEAQCECSALLFAIDGASDEVVLLYPNPYEPQEGLAPGRVLKIPSSEDAYSLRAVGGQGMDIIKLVVLEEDPDFPPTIFTSWSVASGDEKRVAELERLLERLEGARWATAETPLHIAR